MPEQEQPVETDGMKCARCLQPASALVVWTSGNVRVVVCLPCSKILEGQVAR